MATIQIKNVPPDLHEAARMRARLNGLSLSDYLLELIRQDLQVPDLAAWFAMVDMLEPVPGVDGAALIREMRDALEAP